MLGNALTNEKTGIGACLNFYLTPLFANLSPLIFNICILGSAVILTNLCNSLVIGMLLQPVVLAYCQTTGADAAPIIGLMTCFVLASACVTPAASPFAALLHGNKEWLQKSDAYKYGGLFVVIQTVIILLLGIPLSNIVM